MMRYCTNIILGASFWIFMVSFGAIEGVKVVVEPSSASNVTISSSTSPLIEATDLPDVFQYDCQCAHDQQQELDTRFLFLITVHNKRTIEDAVYAFRALRAAKNIILIHVDKKCDWNVYLNSTLYKEVTACPCGTHVQVDSLHDSKWSTWSMNLPTLWAMELGTTKYKDQWDVFMNLSGDTLPVYTIDVMSRLFDGPLRNTNFVTSSSCETGFLPSSIYIFPEYWHKRRHYTSHPDGDAIITYVDNTHGAKQTFQLKTYFGSQWMTLRPDFCEWIVASLRDPNSLPSKYRDWLVKYQKLMTDETFIPTLLMQVSPFNETLPAVNKDGALKALPSMKAIRYERMDENVPTAFGYFSTDQRYEVPPSSIADVPKVWGPYYLGVYDLADIRESGALFIRKVTALIDPNLVRLLPVRRIDEIPDIRWPNEVKLSDKPDWEKKKAELIRKAKEEKEEEEEVKESTNKNQKERVVKEELRL